MKRVSKWLGFISMMWAPLFAHYLDIEGDFLYLKRNLADNNTIIETPTQTITAKNVASDFPYRPALQVKGTFYPTDKEAIQIRYIGLLSYKANVSASDEGNIDFTFNSDIDLYDWVEADRAQAFYDSDYFSFALDYYNFFVPRWNNYFSLDWGVGLDYIEIKEQFKVRYYEDYRTSKYDIKTGNTLLGAHLLGDIVAQPFKWVAWGVQARIGLNVNLMRMKSFLNDNNSNTLIMNQAAHKVRPNYMMEISPYILFRPVSAVQLIIGYTMLYYRGIAMAPNQINYNPYSLDGIDSSDEQNYRGFYAGLGISF